MVSDEKGAATPDDVNLKICDSSNSCCTIDPLSSKANGYFKSLGALKTFRGQELQNCRKSTFKRGSLKATLYKTGGDGFKMKWIKIRLSSGDLQTCKFSRWLTGSPLSATVTCEGG